MMTKAMLLRVGIDKGSGGSLAPVFPDGSFEYIPIPESRDTTETRTYATIVGRCGRPLSAFVRPKLKYAAPHFDPEFETFTYGDPTPNKRRQLLQLEPGDLLVFYAGLQPDSHLDHARIFAIGHVEVESIHDLGDITRNQYPALRKRIGRNAHFFRNTPDKSLVVVKGKKARSRLLKKAIPFGDAKDRMLGDIHSLGYDGSLLRAIGHWIRDGEAVVALKRWLKHGPASLVDNGTRLFSYVITHDTGFAPNPFGGSLTLACCKPQIRNEASVGDWIVGMCPKRMDPRKVTFTMRVNETLSFREYFRDERFQHKKPTAMATGDNIYNRTRTGKVKQLRNPFHGPQDIAHDTNTDRMLVGSIYWYFGGDAISPPDDLADHLVYPYVGRKVVCDADVIRSYVRWLSSQYRMGIHGEPREQAATCA